MGLTSCLKFSRQLINPSDESYVKTQHIQFNQQKLSD